MKIILTFLVMMISSASYSQVVSNEGEPYPQFIEEDFYGNGNLEYQKLFDPEIYSKSGELVVKKYTGYYEDGHLHLKLEMKNSLLHGNLLAYWKNGKLKRKGLYKMGVLVEGKSWDMNGNVEECGEFEIPSQVKEN